MTEEQLERRLERPVAFPVDTVLDTDTYNEIDDQYALAYLLANQDRLRLRAITAAPFSNRKAATPEEGMELSRREILNVLGLTGHGDLSDIVFSGSRSYLSSDSEPVVSPAARRILELSEGREDDPIYVIAIGAATNVASAILMDPSVIERMVVVWLGGNAGWWPRNDEFNLRQDIRAARVLFDSGVPLIQLPCMGVVSSFSTTGPELEHHLRGRNAFCDYIVDLTEKEALSCGQGDCWARVIWDVTAVAWLLDGRFTESSLVPSPVLGDDGTYRPGTGRHMIRCVWRIDREKLFSDLFRKLSGAAR